MTSKMLYYVFKIRNCKQMEMFSDDQMRFCRYKAAFLCRKIYRQIKKRRSFVPNRTFNYNNDEFLNMQMILKRQKSIKSSLTAVRTYIKILSNLAF